jgi:hypothetical protein
MRGWLTAGSLLLAGALVATQTASPQRQAARSGLTTMPADDLRRDPALHYDLPSTHDRVAELDRRIQQGLARLSFDSQGQGYLRSVLEALGVPVESQVVAFSKTSFQAARIGPSNPRAIYFNDTVAVGWVRGGPIVEIAADDPEQGVIFYTLVGVPSFPAAGH